MSDAATTAAIADSDLSGRLLGNYQLLRRLGRGAMAEVYLAEQISLRRQVAFKVLRKNLATDASYVQRFHREAQAAASLVHANIVQIYEVGCIDGIHFIAQEYVQGMNLGQLLDRSGPPALKQSLSIILQAAAALHKAAEHGIVHRDIKPENILIAESSEVKVADFGLARIAGDENSTTLTQAGFTMGTPLYMSPEQVEGKRLDGRSDIYSLGVTCYHLLAGRPPFQGESPLSVAVQHLHDHPSRLESLRPDLPPALCRIVHKMLAKDPVDRYPDVRELVCDLRALALTELEERELHAVSDVSGQLLPANSPSHAAATARLDALMTTAKLQAPRRSQDLWWIAAAAAAFLVGLGCAFAINRPLIPWLPASNPAVPRKANAKAQYVYAVMVDTEEAWQSVAAYHPHDRLHGLRAQQQLARLYLGKDDYARAMAIFTEFANQPETEQQLRAFGLAGQAVVLAFEGRHVDSADKLAELWPLHASLDPQMKGLMTYVLRRNKKALAGPATDRWLRYLEPAIPDGTEAFRRERSGF